MGGIEGIGGTAVVRLERLAGEGSAEVWVKLAAANPDRLLQGRMALATGGSTGSSLAFVCAVIGTSRALAAKLPGLHRVVVEPAESAVLSGGPPGTHHIEGGGIGRWPPLLRAEDFDEVVAVPEAAAFAMARQAASTEGVFSGPSTGANLVAACQLARCLGAGHRVVTVQIDSGLKYLAGGLSS